MTIKPSGSPLRFSEIAAEFGIPPGKNLGAYRLSLNVGSLTNLPLDVGVPQSGPIGFSSFYSKKLNIVVDLHSIPDFSLRQTARVRYNNTNVTLVTPSNTISRPDSSANTRIIINVNKVIGSSKNNINDVALRTGSWEPNTELELEIGPSGALYGSGGNGGKGADSGSNGNPGLFGTSALGIDYPTNVRNRGYIQAGGGGGGGSGYYSNNSRSSLLGLGIFRRRTNRRNPGNGGGGGAGFPIGQKGLKGTGGENNAVDGNDSSFNVRGLGGSNNVSPNGGNGGNGGLSGVAGDSSSGLGGAGGLPGRAIIIYNNGSGTVVAGVGTIVGSTIFNTNPT
jgi:hypothetical protein